MRCFPRLSPTLPLLEACHSFKDLSSETILQQSLKTSVKESKCGKIKQNHGGNGITVQLEDSTYTGSFLRLSVLEITDYHVSGSGQPVH